MQKNDNISSLLLNEEDNFNIRHEIEKYAYHWKWFLLTIIIALSGAYFYLRYTPNVYEVSTTILIEDESAGGLSSELSAFEDLGLMGGSKKNMENEMAILKSRRLLGSVVKNLKLNVTYFKTGNVKSSEVFQKDAPFKVTFFAKDSTFYSLSKSFLLEIVSPTRFVLTNLKEDTSTTHSFGEKIVSDHFDMTLLPQGTIEQLTANRSYTFKLSPIKTVVNNLRKSIQVNLLNKKSSIVELKLSGFLKSKSKAILDELVSQYNKDAVASKRVIGENTDAFINTRLKIIENDLANIDKSVERFKVSNKITDIPTETALVLGANSEIEKHIIELNSQLKLVDYFKDYISSSKDVLIPENIGLSASEVSSNTELYNELLMERTRISKSSGDNNPVLVNLDSQIKQLQASISQGLENLKSRLEISLREAINQEAKMNSRIASTPKQEREYRDIQRQQQIIETLYLFLLQKREENAITLAVTVPNAKLIDKAAGSDIPISPKRKIIYLAALALGFLIPFGILYISFLLDTKVHSQKELEQIVKAPFVGTIPTTTNQDRMLVKEDNGGIAEAFRMLRTNVIFMLSPINKPSKNIFITSSVSGEGKTFVSINLATVFAMTNKKILLIGADIRKPKVAEYLEMSSGNTGLTLFLADKSIEPKAIIEPQEKWGFDIIQSGVIPPNPVELLMNGRFDELLAYSNAHYDYVIVDTAPVNLVTDTLQIASKADMFLYISRANYIDKRLLQVPKELFEQKRLPNMALVINGTDPKKGYGYGYGYGYSNEKKSWWSRFKRS